jgi:hypothetical protein
MAKTRRYTTHTADAKGIRCDICGAQTTKAIRVEVGPHKGGGRGSRTIGLFCEQHCQEKLADLRAKLDKETQRR